LGEISKAHTRGALALDVGGGRPPADAPAVPMRRGSAAIGPAAATATAGGII
jgi:hypothetical protein